MVALAVDIVEVDDLEVVEDIAVDQVDIVEVTVTVVAKADIHRVHLRVDDQVEDILDHLAKAVSVVMVVDIVVIVVAHAQVLLENTEAGQVERVSQVDIADIVIVVTLLVERRSKKEAKASFYFFSLARSSFIFLPNTSTEYSPARDIQSFLMANARSGVIHFTASMVS